MQQHTIQPGAKGGVNIGEKMDMEQKNNEGSRRKKQGEMVRNGGNGDCKKEYEGEKWLSENRNSNSTLYTEQSKVFTPRHEDAHALHLLLYR